MGAPESVATAAPLLNPSIHSSDSSRRPPRTTTVVTPLRVFQCICTRPHRDGVSRTALSCFHAQQRCCATIATTTDGDSAGPSATSAEEFEKVFFDYPVAERLAALTVARHEVGHCTESTAATGMSATSTSWLYMPIKDFVKKMSPLTREDMFRRQLDALEWITESKLLQLVNEGGEAIRLESLRAYPTAAGPASQSKDAHPALYNGLVHVRTTVPAAWLLQAGGGAGSVPEVKRPCSQLTHSTPSGCGVAGAASAVTEPPFTPDESHDGKDAAAALSTAERETIIREALLWALRDWDAAMQQRRERAASATSDPAPNLPRYTHLITVYNAILREAAVTTSASGEGAGVEVAPNLLTPTARYILKRLRMSTLESIVDNIGVVVTIGNTASASAQAPNGYPAMSSRPIWVVRGTARNPVTFVALRYSTDASPPRFRDVQPRVTVATRANNYGGWGSASVVPTKADVYEILKYVPVNWGSISNLNLPPEVKKRHIRTSSTLVWFRRQPFYFEVRDMNGTVELRRSIVLHPEVHGMTREEAWEVLELQMATGEANSLVPLGVDGAPLRPTERVFDRSVTKFVYRVCPTYFAPLSLTMQRYVKKNLTEPMLMTFVRRFPQDFEVFTSRYSDIPLVRRRAGADSARWMSDFVADLERYPEDVRAILILCNAICAAWDRPEYVYVRLSPTEQEVVGGYAGMQVVLSRHPAIFRVGRHFVCRADPSNPLAQREAEPAVDDVTTISPIHEENPYHSPKELALVFHYVMPEDEACTAAYLVDCSSPAMRAVLPPRLVTIVQLFPKMFACTETSPGVYSIRKVKQPVRRAARGAAGAARDGRSTGNDAPALEDSCHSAEKDTIQMLEDELADEDHMTREEVVQAVRMLIPESGVEVPQLLLWASMSVQRAANEYFGGLLRLVEAHPGQFRVTTNEHTKKVYKK
ncbi:conserved hypothetical protein [Leishmania major strain Friedlin]|uniref:Uncharacterized protein n=1 Tax=Leishmania major TaxID=5664 RepID=Q4QBM4_LEIMA|nr:conserved hypothetical protein [Leishmania major strain Friedlin]CAG9573989.1 hypothetical_protein_-_conserved [Leishmania major strain Friedlin]CAJ04611.1 conserved hypothetical protein [Leishmania major strain Friedlin]|eukprot:XP_001683274.1 conserved hypothetical protein [Leishmania major strain Friedlin]